MNSDLISVVETCYDLSLDWAGLTRELARVAENILPIDTLPAAYTVKKQGDAVHVGNLVAEDHVIRQRFSTRGSPRN